MVVMLCCIIIRCISGSLPFNVLSHSVSFFFYCVLLHVVYCRLWCVVLFWIYLSFHVKYLFHPDWKSLCCPICHFVFCQYKMTFFLYIWAKQTTDANIIKIITQTKRHKQSTHFSSAPGRESHVHLSVHFDTHKSHNTQMWCKNLQNI